MALILIAILIAPLPLMLVMVGRGLLSGHEEEPIARKVVIYPPRSHA
jgi:hypothetical protein